MRVINDAEREGFQYDLRRKKDGGKVIKAAWRGKIGPESRVHTPHLTDYPMTLKWALKPFKGGSRVFIEMIRAYAQSENDKSNGDARRLVDACDAKHPGRGKKTNENIDLDALCAELGIATPTAYGWFSEMSYLHGQNIMRVRTAINGPVVMQASIDRSLDLEEGGEERKVLFEVMGLLPKRGGPTVAVQQNTSIAAPTGSDPVVTFEDQQRRTAQLLRAPLKTVGAGTTIKKPEEERVPPAHHDAAARRDR